MMKVHRTPDSRFEGLPDFDFKPNYQTIVDNDGTELRVHYIDEGPRDAAPIVLMHGNPTWSYLYRKMIPGLVAAGHRVLAVDLIGCGRSDKPAKKKYYTQRRHVEWMTKWYEAMELRKVTLFCQDWGGTIGLTIVAEQPERFDRVVAANTGLLDGRFNNRWLRVWQRVMRFLPMFPFKKALGGAIINPAFTAADFAGYKAPFDTLSAQAGILKFPMLLGVYPHQQSAIENRKTLAKLGEFDKPFLTLFATRDPVTKGGERALIKLVPGCKGQPHERISGAGHFLQEDKPDELVEAVVNFIASTSSVESDELEPTQ